MTPPRFSVFTDFPAEQKQFTDWKVKSPIHPLAEIYEFTPHDTKLAITFSVEQAKKIIVRENLPTGIISVNDAFKSWGFLCERQPGKATDVDLTVPVIVIQYIDPNRPTHIDAVMIDGYGRLHVAFMKKQEFLPLAFVPVKYWNELIICFETPKGLVVVQDNLELD